MLAELSSPHCIKYYDSFLDSGQLYIVMEHAEGGSLHEYLQAQGREPLPENLVRIPHVDPNRWQQPLCLLECSTFVPNTLRHASASISAADAPVQVWRLLLQLALGLHHMHSKRILHRDLKSMNVLLDAKLNATIGDVGVAKVSLSRALQIPTV